LIGGNVWALPTPSVERQLTHAPRGHILTNTGVWSPNGAWIVYDTRSDAAGDLFDGRRIERVNVHTGEVELLYESRNGAHCGVATCSPVDERVVFILGPEHPTPDWRYSAWHRQGVIVDSRRPGEIVPLDARNVTPPFTPGALRGGTHVHVFSPDGTLVSCTYEDHVLAECTRCEAAVDLNQRNVAVCVPHPVTVPRTHPRNHDGDFFSVVVTQTTNRPRPGSDEIDRAYEDAWIGSAQRRALAFLGNVVTATGGRLTELFRVVIPNDLTLPGNGPLEGTTTRRPAPPEGVCQQRLTFTEERPFPGVCGPRHWPRSSPDGSRIAFLMRDDAGRAQLWTISPSGDELRQLTRDVFPTASAFTWNDAGTHLAYVAANRVTIVDAATGASRPLTQQCDDELAPRPEACVFSPDGSQIAFVRRLTSAAGCFNQVCVVDVG
jgi:hypothetical protein